MKTIVLEPESRALLRFLRHPVRVSCALARTEVVRAVRHLCLEFAERAREAFRRVDLIHVDDALLDAAAALDPRVPRSLDAIHLAAAMTLGSQLVAVVTYDVRMADAARLVGLPTVAPS